MSDWIFPTLIFLLQVLSSWQRFYRCTARVSKIRGQISINRGWPQEITVEWPKELSKNSALTEMKFSTKLAPLPD